MRLDRILVSRDAGPGTKGTGIRMTTIRVLLVLDLIAAEDAAQVPGIPRDVREETPAVLPEVAAALPPSIRRSLQVPGAAAESWCSASPGSRC